MSKQKVVKKNNENDETTILELFNEFINNFDPYEKKNITLMKDNRTKASYCECHVKASKLIKKGSIDVPLDPDEQPDYRANRDIVEDHVAYQKMIDDALGRRSFSNIVSEYNDTFDSELPLKIIGGQHRFLAIKKALESKVDEYHGIKVYFGLDMTQRLDVQLISNTNIAVSPDLLDRMYETVSGPELRDWCHKTGLLEKGEDFEGKKQRGKQITVRVARTFILNFYKGQCINAEKFDTSKTAPILPKTGGVDTDWEQLKNDRPKLWNDKKLIEAGKNFAALIMNQRNYFKDKEDTITDFEYADKPTNYAVISAWAFVAGLLSKNSVRLKRHYKLAEQKGHDPLNTAVLSLARHKSDPDNYRGLGNRTDPKERGRFVEIFFLQTEKGDGIKKSLVDLAIKKYHAKLAMIEVKEAEGKYE